jgi:hypothetical protein
MPLPSWHVRYRHRKKAKGATMADDKIIRLTRTVSGAG